MSSQPRAVPSPAEGRGWVPRASRGDCILQRVALVASMPALKDQSLNTLLLATNFIAAANICVAFHLYLFIHLNQHCVYICIRFHRLAKGNARGDLQTFTRTRSSQIVAFGHLSLKTPASNSDFSAEQVMGVFTSVVGSNQGKKSPQPVLL